MKYRPSLREGISVGLRVACLALLLQGAPGRAQDEAPPRPPISRPDPMVKKALPDLPANVFAPAPCLCTTWKARIADIERRHEELGRRNGVIEGRVIKIEMIPTAKREPEMRAVEKFLIETSEFREKISRDVSILNAEIKQHNEKHGKGVWHSIPIPNPKLSFPPGPPPIPASVPSGGSQT